MRGRLGWRVALVCGLGSVSAIGIAVDRRTDGRRKAILGYRFGDGLWAYLGAVTYKQSALRLAIDATRRVVAG